MIIYKMYLQILPYLTGTVNIIFWYSEKKNKLIHYIKINKKSIEKDKKTKNVLYIKFFFLYSIIWKTSILKNFRFKISFW